jgi:RNA polymerase II-associated factor 1
MVYLDRKVANQFSSQVHEQYQDKWEIIRVSHSAMSKEEEDEREEALAEVVDPMFLMVRGDADADGEIEIEEGGVVNGGVHVSAGA